MRTLCLALLVSLTLAGCHENGKAPQGRVRILVTPDQLTLARFDSAQVMVEAVEASGDTIGRPFTFQPQDPTLVSMSPQGLVRSLGPVGSTKVFIAETFDDVYDTLYVSVGTALQSIRLSPADTAIGLNGRIAYTVIAHDAYGVVTGVPFTLSFSPDSGYLTDSADRVVKATGHAAEVVVTVQSGTTIGKAGVTVADTLTAGRLPASGHPRWVAIDPAGRGFVTRGSAQFVSQYDAAARKPGPSLVVPSGVAAAALDSAGSRLYVATSTLVLGLDASTGVAVDTVSSGSQPLGVAVAPDGLTLWVSAVGDVLLVYDRVSGGLVKTLNASTMTRFAGSLAGDSLLYGMTSGGVIEINTVTDSLERSFGGGGSLTDLAVTADGKTLFTSDAGKKRVTVWSLTSGTVVDSIPLAAAPQGLALSSDGAQLWVTVPSLGEALVYDPATLGLSKTVTLHGRPMGVGVGPTGTVALVANDSGWVDVVPR